MNMIAFPVPANDKVVTTFEFELSSFDEIQCTNHSNLMICIFFLFAATIALQVQIFVLKRNFNCMAVEVHNNSTEIWFTNCKLRNLALMIADLLGVRVQDQKSLRANNV